MRVTYDYYPFGLTWENPKLPGTEEGLHDHTYQDKEYQFAEFSDGRGLELHDFHARMYDATTGRWLVPDPAAQFANPYLAMGNNPVISVDPDGRFAHIIAGAVVGTFVGLAVGMISGNLDYSNWWQYALVGALSGALTAGTAGGASAMLAGQSFGAGFLGTATATATSSFVNGAVIGTASGFTGGFVNGVGQGWIQNSSFGESIEMGVTQGVIGGMIGGISGGVISGTKALFNNKNFFTGEMTFKDKSDFFFDKHDEWLRAEFGDETIESTEFRGKRFMRGHGLTVGSDVDPSSEMFRTDKQVVYISRKDINAFYRGTSDQIGTPKLFHEVFHARDYHNGIPESWFDGSYTQQMIEFRAYSYEFNKFHTEGSAKYLSLYTPFTP